MAVREVTGDGGVSLAVDVVGDGPPVLLVHGFPDSRALWRNQVGPLAEAGRRVIVPDLRGFGESGAPRGRRRLPGDDGRRRPRGRPRRARRRAGRRGRPRLGRGASRGRWRSCARTACARSPRCRSGTRTRARPPTLEAREKAWYQLLFQFEEAEELLLRDDAALLREWLGDAADAERYLADLSRPGALTAGLNYYRANLHPRRALEWRPLPPAHRPDARCLEQRRPLPGRGARCAARRARHRPVALRARRRRRALDAARRARGGHRAAAVTPLVLADDAVDQAVLGGLVGGEEAVALHVLVDLLLRLPACASRRSRRSACGS